MNKLLLFLLLLIITTGTFAQSNNIVLKDLAWDKAAPAGMAELTIPSEGAKLAAIMYTANGKAKHPTLILLHGFPGNERNLDLAQAVRAHGWNVVYFNYRGAWGSQGKFSFRHCIEDAKNVVAFCNKYQDSLRIDTGNIVLFGHSVGGMVCLKTLEQLPQIKKGFALSAADFHEYFKPIPNERILMAVVKDTVKYPDYISLNTSTADIFLAVYKELPYYYLVPDIKALKRKKLMMVDENQRNKGLADAIKASVPQFFDYQVWDTDHSFTNKRASLMNAVISFLDK